VKEEDRPPMKRELTKERQALLDLGEAQPEIVAAMEIFQRASRYAPVVPPSAPMVRYSTSSSS
jgi:hypothetical protein